MPGGVPPPRTPTSVKEVSGGVGVPVPVTPTAVQYVEPLDATQKMTQEEMLPGPVLSVTEDPPSSPSSLPSASQCQTAINELAQRGALIGEVVMGLAHGPPKTEAKTRSEDFITGTSPPHKSACLEDPK